MQTPLASDDQHKTSRHTLVIMLGTVVSRLLGFVRDAAMAWLLGGSPLADALSVALRLPYVLRRLLGEGTLSLALTTACARGNEVVVVRAVARRLALFAWLFTALGMLLAAPLTGLLAPGLHGEVLAEAVELVRWCLPYAALAVATAGSMALLHSRERFGWPSLSPVLFNTVVIAAAVGCAYFALPPETTAQVLVSSVVAGGLAQWLLQRVALGLVDEPRLGVLSDPVSVRKTTVTPLFVRVVAGVAGAAMPQLAFLLAGLLSSFLPAGHMAALFYAERLLEFPLGVLGAAVGMASAPELARLAAGFEKGNKEGWSATAQAHGQIRESASDLSPEPDTARLKQLFAQRLSEALTLAVAFNLPAAAGLVAVATPLVGLVLGHGAFDEDAVRMTALALCAYAPALPAYAASRPLLAACHALQRDRAPLVALGVGLATALVVGGLGLPWGAVAPPLGVSIALWVNAACLWLALARCGVCIHLPLKNLAGQGLSAVLVWVAASGAVRWAAACSPVAALALAVPVGIAAYGAGLAVTGNVQFLRKCFAARLCKNVSTE